MSRNLHIWPQETTERDGTTTVSAMIARDGHAPFHLRFEIPSEYRDAVSKTCDPFVIATIFSAMRNSQKVVVHGGVSSSLLRNIEEFQAVWCSWVPEMYSDVEIIPDVEYKSCGDSASRKAVMAFSGGLDSCFTAYRHSKRTCGRLRQDVSAGIMVHGFDIPVDDQRTFELAKEKSRTILGSLGIRLIPVATNFRDLGDNWDNAHGAGVAASLMLFQNGYGIGLIAGSFSYDSFNLNIPWGSNPLTDGMLSSDDFHIVNDGSRFSRVDKLKHISAWPEAMEHMRVCWEGSRLDRNCCRCEKCIRGILSCHVLGMDLPKCFESDVTEQQVMNVRVPDMAILFEYRCMLTAAMDTGAPTSLVRLLKACIRSNEQRLTASGSLWRRARSRIAPGNRVRKLYGKLSTWLRRSDIEVRKA